MRLFSTQIQDIYSKLIKCICSTDPNCQRESPIYDIQYPPDFPDADDRNYNISYIVPGATVGCSAIGSLLLSTLECFYSDSICFSELLHHIKQMYYWNLEDPLWFDPVPLIYNRTSTHFYPNSTISIAIKIMMIEEWNPSYSYQDFYRLCSPSYCIYEETIYSNNSLGIIVILISMIGGMIISLRFLTPYLFSLTINLILKIIRKQNFQEQEQQQNVMNLCGRLKLFKQKMIKSIRDTLLNLNIFPIHTFGANINRAIARTVGVQSTRLFLLLFATSFIVLTLYTITQQQILTKEFKQPSFNAYNKLIKSYGTDLKCSCSSISSTYDEFIDIEPKFHEICSSPFASNEMIDNLAISLSSNQLISNKRDYRLLISAHIQYLTGLCQISIRSVDSSIKNFLSTLFIKRELVFEDEFYEHIDSSIELTKQTAPDVLDSIFFLIRNINFGNAIISTYGTNFKYVLPLEKTFFEHFATEAEIYDDDCSCGLRLNCTSQAYFIENNSSNKIHLPGLKIGCTSSDSFLSSTLECFYNQSCVDIIEKYTNYSNSLQSLSNQSRINLTIYELVKNLFIDQLLTRKNYSAYYEICSPSLCSYNYIQKFNLVYTIYFLLGFQGGLTIVLRWICPRIIQFKMTIEKYRKNRTRVVHLKPVIQTVSENVSHGNKRAAPNLRLGFMKILLICIFFMIIIVVLVIFSIYVVRQENNQTTQTTNTTTITTTTTITDMKTVTISDLTTTTGWLFSKVIFMLLIVFIF